MITEQAILSAYKRISPYIIKTPIITCERLNDALGHEILFKAECQQVTGSFKVRGVLNAILSLKEQESNLKKITAYSSGNHARAIAWVGKEIADLSTEIYMHKSASISKQNAIKALGASLITTEKRKEAETWAREAGNLEGNYFLHPSDNDMVIAGAATLGLEAFKQLGGNVDAVFAACGGGALLSGTYLGKKTSGANTKIFAAEPEIANDAARSYSLKKIVGFEESPLTIADGLRTLKVSERTFNYLKELDGFIEASEEEIIYWFVWLNKLLGIPCEPTSVVAMACAAKWLKSKSKKQRVLIVLSGGNVDAEHTLLFEDNKYLNYTPSL